MEEYFKKMAPRDKIKKQNESYMPSTVFTQQSTELSKQNKTLRGFLRQQHENRFRDARNRSKRIYSQKRDSSQVKNALSCSYGNDSDSLFESKLTMTKNKCYPYHHKNTFNRIVKGDPEYDHNFRSKYLYKPVHVPNCRKDNINELFQLQEKFNEEDETLPTSPNRLCFSQMCTITQETLRMQRNNPIYL